jgi:phosphoenolpyruvate-protein kinase (PTS system EI component)
MGMDELSMSPNLIRLVKRVVSQVSFADAKALADSVRRMMGTPADQIYAFCRNQLIKLVPDLPYLQ